MTEDRSPIGRLFGAVVPRAVDAIDPDALVDRIDVDELVSRIDVDGLVKRVDLDELLASIDIDGLLDRIDIGKLLDRIDIDGLIKRVDLDALLASVDLNAMVGRLDVDALVAQLDVDALVARLDVDALVARLDVNALVGRLDLDALLDKVDVKALVAKAGIDEIVAEATTGMAARTLDLFRRQVVGIDIVLARGVDRLLRRPRPDLRGLDLSPTGRPAGGVSRTIAFLVDSALVSLLFSLGVSLGRSMVDLFTGGELATGAIDGPWWAVAFFAWWYAYLWVGLEVAGKTPGKALVGLRVHAVGGAPLRPGKAALRVAAYPFSFVLGLGFVPAILRKDRRALHDLIAGSHETVDWGDRRAELPSALQRWVAEHQAELEAEAAEGEDAEGGGEEPPTAAPELSVVPDPPAAVR